MLCVEMLVNRIHCLTSALWRCKAREHRPSLSVEVDLSILILVATNRCTIMVKVHEIPFTIPGMLFYAALHFGMSFAPFIGFIILTEIVKQANELIQCAPI